MKNPYKNGFKLKNSKFANQTNNHIFMILIWFTQNRNSIVTHKIS
jgi:hypothetical protein